MKLDFNQAFERALNKPENIKVKKHLASFQFKISQEILGKRISLGLSPKEVACSIGMSEQEFRDYENGTNLTATEHEYESVLAKLTDLQEVSEQRTLDSNKELYGVRNGETSFRAKDIYYSKEKHYLLMARVVSIHNQEHVYGYKGLKYTTQEKSESSDETKLPRIFADRHSIQTKEYEIAY